MLKSYIAFDLETTGLSPQEHEIIEIGALKVREGKVVDRFMEFVHPCGEISVIQRTAATLIERTIASRIVTFPP